MKKPDPKRWEGYVFLDVAGGFAACMVLFEYCKYPFWYLSKLLVK